LAGFLADINENNRALQSSAETKINQLQETVRADIRSENKKLIKRFEMENQNLSKEFSKKLNSESRK
jgi:hypothetical protein